MGKQGMAIKSTGVFTAAKPGSDGAVLRQHQVGAVLVLSLFNRPVNALSAQLRTDLAQALMAAQDNPSVQAVVIASDTAQFSAGADMAELGQSALKPNLSMLCSMVENFPKPIVAAMNGNAVGGGLELALAAHARVADVAAQMGLPEVNLGIVPGAGGTQRLPRLVGASAAMQIMFETKPVLAAQALAIGLVDAVVEQGLRDAAIAMALRLTGRAPNRTADRTDGMRDPAAYRAALAARRKQFASARQPAALRIIDCVEAAQLLPIEQGLAYESAAFDDLVNTPDAKGLRHAFMAERRALFPPADLAAYAPPVLGAIAVWGGGDRAADVIVQALGAGLRVNLVDPRREDLVATLQRIATRQETAVAEGRLTPETRDADWARLAQSLDLAALKTADLILLSADAPAIGDTNGQPPMITLGPLVPRAPADAVALVPAPAQGLAAELCAGHAAPVELRALAMAFGRRLGWKVLFSGPGGPIERRLRAAISAAITGLEAAGLDRPTIALALASQGLGLSETADLPAKPPEVDAVLAACMAALAATGARMISEGVARRPADVDAATMLNGILPRRFGGPMFWADQRGLIVIRADLQTRATAAPQLYTPDPLFDTLIRDGLDFAALNRK